MHSRYRAVFLLVTALLIPGGLARAQEGEQAAPSPIDAQIERARASMKKIVEIPDGERTFENTVGAMDDLVATFFNDARMTCFMESVHPDEAVREKGTAATRAMGEFFIEFEQHIGLYRALEAFARTEPKLEGERARLLKHLLRDFRRAGMDLPDEKRERMLALEKELNDLSIEFRKNIREDDTSLLLTEAELAGVSPDFLKTLPRIGELYHCKLNGPIAGRVFSRCEVGATRLKFSAAYGRRALDNIEVLEKMLKLRAEKAKLLGYENFSAFQVETRMSKTPANIKAFYDDLRPKLREKAKLDFAELQAAKRAHTGDPDAVLNAWDASFYIDRLKVEKYAVDQEKIREYFSLEEVTKGLFSITQKIYGIEYTDITAEAEKRERPIWHEDVKLFEVKDKASGEVLGEFYIDLHPRENKYNHAAQFPLHLRKRWADGKLSRPLVALVCNFTKPTEDKPALLSHSEVETYFHEFGHCLHSILTEASFVQFSGTQVARDFVEAPSQMFENWVWDAEVLGTFAKHYETGAAFPKELLDGMLKAQHLGSGLRAEGQVYLGLMDFSYHIDEDGELDTDAIREKVYAEARLFPPLPGTHSQASFGHLTGYASGYYGYLWSLVFAQDMFTRFKGRALDPKIGMEYRKKILSRGGTVDELDMVRDFLGREPNGDAFLEHLGLGKKKGEKGPADKTPGG